MDLWIAAALLLLVVWAIATFVLGAPGWIHFFLTAGMTMLIWRVVARSLGTPRRR